MRKVDPIDVCDQVKERLTELLEFYDTGWAAFETQPHAATRCSSLSELVFHRAYVEVEAFLSAYFIGCINRDATTLIAFRRSQIQTSIRAKYSQTSVDYVSFEPPAHPSVAVVTGLVGGSEYNLTFTSYQKMVERAAEWLAPQWAGKIGAVTVERQRVMDAAKSIRNCIAHQSKASFDSMNEALLALPAHGVCGQLRRRVRAVNSVGAYLKARQNGMSRTAIFLGEFKCLADALK
jgi:hypothetical protein